MQPVRTDRLKPGDHIYTHSYDGVVLGVGSYDHHGIYVGIATIPDRDNSGRKRTINDAVIHFLGLFKKSSQSHKCKKCFHTADHDGVVITCLDCFLDGGSAYLYQYGVSIITFHLQTSGSCTTTVALPPERVVKTAYKYLSGEKSFGVYNFFFNNCESFATCCKTGTPECNQILHRTGVVGSIAYSVAKNILWG